MNQEMCRQNKEEFDWKRFWLLNRKAMWKLIPAILLGCLLFGGVYLLNRVVFAEPDVYRSQVLYSITFEPEQNANIHHYYNDYTWNDILDSDQIAGVAAEALGYTKEEVAAAVSIPTMSDIRLIWVYAQHTDPHEAERIQSAIGEALILFAQRTDGFERIEVWDTNDTEVIEEDFLLGRNLVCGAIVGLVTAALWLCHKHAMDDSVYLERDVQQRYGVPAIGAVFKECCEDKDKKNTEAIRRHLAAVMEKNHFRGDKVMFAYAYDEMEGNFTPEMWEKILPQDCNGVCVRGAEQDETFLKQLRENGFWVMLVPFGKKDGSKLERIMDYYAVSNCVPDAVLIMNTDRFFYDMYYKIGGKRSKE